MADSGSDQVDASHIDHNESRAHLSLTSASAPPDKRRGAGSSRDVLKTLKSYAKEQDHDMRSDKEVHHQSSGRTGDLFEHGVKDHRRVDHQVGRQVNRQDGRSVKIRVEHLGPIVESLMKRNWGPIDRGRLMDEVRRAKDGVKKIFGGHRSSDGQHRKVYVPARRSVEGDSLPIGLGIVDKRTHDLMPTEDYQRSRPFASATGLHGRQYYPVEEVSEPSFDSPGGSVDETPLFSGYDKAERTKLLRWYLAERLGLNEWYDYDGTSSPSHVDMDSKVKTIGSDMTTDGTVTTRRDGDEENDEDDDHEHRPSHFIDFFAKEKEKLEALAAPVTSSAPVTHAVPQLNHGHHQSAFRPFQSAATQASAPEHRQGAFRLFQSSAVPSHAPGPSGHRPTFQQWTDILKNAVHDPVARPPRPVGRPKGTKNPLGSKKTGPPKGSHYKPGRKGYSHPVGSTRGANWRKPGPIKGAPRPEAKKTGPKKGSKRPAHAAKPGPKVGSKHKDGSAKPGPKLGSKRKRPQAASVSPSPGEPQHKSQKRPPGSPPGGGSAIPVKRALMYLEHIGNLLERDRRSIDQTEGLQGLLTSIIERRVLTEIATSIIKNKGREHAPPSFKVIADMILDPVTSDLAGSSRGVVVPVPAPLPTSVRQDITKSLSKAGSQSQRPRLKPGPPKGFGRGVKRKAWWKPPGPKPGTNAGVRPKDGAGFKPGYERSNELARPGRKVGSKNRHKPKPKDVQRGQDMPLVWEPSGPRKRPKKDLKEDQPDASGSISKRVLEEVVGAVVKDRMQSAAASTLTETVDQVESQADSSAQVPPRKGRRPGSKNKAGYKRPGPRVGSKRPEGAKKGGFPIGTKRKESWGRPGPKLGSKRLKPSIAVGTPRPESWAKPGPKIGSTKRKFKAGHVVELDRQAPFSTPQAPLLTPQQVLDSLTADPDSSSWNKRGRRLVELERRGDDDDDDDTRPAFIDFFAKEKEKLAATASPIIEQVASLLPGRKSAFSPYVPAHSRSPAPSTAATASNAATKAPSLPNAQESIQRTPGHEPMITYRYPKGGRPRGSKNPEGSKKTGPKAGSKYPKGAKKPGPRVGSKNRPDHGKGGTRFTPGHRPQTWAKTGPKFKQPGEPGFRSRTKRPPGSDKPGTKRRKKHGASANEALQHWTPDRSPPEPSSGFHARPPGSPSAGGNGILARRSLLVDLYLSRGLPNIADLATEVHTFEDLILWSTLLQREQELQDARMTQRVDLLMQRDDDDDDDSDDDDHRHKRPKLIDFFAKEKEKEKIAAAQSQVAENVGGFLKEKTSALEHFRPSGPSDLGQSSMPASSSGKKLPVFHQAAQFINSASRSDPRPLTLHPAPQVGHLPKVKIPKESRGRGRPKGSKPKEGALKPGPQPGSKNRPGVKKEGWFYPPNFKRPETWARAGPRVGHKQADGTRKRGRKTGTKRPEGSAKPGPKKVSSLS